MSASGICPTEDAIQALLDYLVEPMLPAKSSSRDNPSQSQLQSVARQVHAVVILYNYYHRKQHPQLEFLSFEAFCKLAVILKPALLSHMNLMQRSDDTELENPEKQLSLTEKAIMNACDITTCLDASKDENIEGWPLSKVAILLIDSKEENCHLLFSSVTHGVWSVIEQDLDIIECQQETMGEEKHVSKKKRVMKKPSKEILVVDEAKTCQLAYSAVKEATGIDQNDLKILESHVVYSLSKEKSTVRFYMIKCTRSVNEDVIQVPIKDTIDSLQDSLFRKNGRRWSVTSKVEYFHILPYARMVLIWFHREISKDGLLGGEKINENLNNLGGIEAPGKLEIHKDQGGARAEDLNKGTSISSEGLERLPDKINRLSSLQDEIYRAQNVNVDDFSGVPSHTVDKKKIVTNTRQVTVSYTKKKNTSQVNSHHEMMTPCVENESNGSENCIKVKDGILTTYPCIAECSGEKIASGNLSDNVSFDQTRNADHALVTCQSNSEHLSKLQAIIVSKEEVLSQAAIRALIRKRDKLSHQLRFIEDEIAQCDKNIQTILRGDEDDLVLKLDSVIDCCNDVCLRSTIEDRSYQCFEEHCSSQYVTRNRLSEAVLCVHNPCQELDGICHKNNWILPTYRVTASDGGFQANVVVKGMDFECSSFGEQCSNPREARESAATKMLTQLWSMLAEDCVVTSQVAFGKTRTNDYVPINNKKNGFWVAIKTAVY